jgi:hypothetical protein
MTSRHVGSVVGVRRLVRLILVAAIVSGALLALRQILAPPPPDPREGARRVPGTPDTWPPVPKKPAGP